MTTYLTVFLKNPGIPGKEYYKDTFKFEKEEDKLNYQKCSVCNIIIPKSFRVVHCQKCKICVIPLSLDRKMYWEKKFNIFLSFWKFFICIYNFFNN